jgi:hypothetical protein
MPCDRRGCKENRFIRPGLKAADVIRGVDGAANIFN